MVVCMRAVGVEDHVVKRGGATSHINHAQLEERHLVAETMQIMQPLPIPSFVRLGCGMLDQCFVVDKVATVVERSADGDGGRCRTTSLSATAIQPIPAWGAIPFAHGWKIIVQLHSVLLMVESCVGCFVIQAITK